MRGQWQTGEVLELPYQHHQPTAFPPNLQPTIDSKDIGLYPTASLSHACVGRKFECLCRVARDIWRDTRCILLIDWTVRWMCLLVYETAVWFFGFNLSDINALMYWIHCIFIRGTVNHRLPEAWIDESQQRRPENEQGEKHTDRQIDSQTDKQIGF